MAKRVFFSFHYQDVIDFRANVVRNSWISKPDREEAGFFDHSLWESARKKDPDALKRLINDGLEGSSVTAVLIGSESYGRRWVRYEIMKSLERGNKLLGVHINSVTDKYRQTKLAGPNPFDYLGVQYSDDGWSLRLVEWNGQGWVYYQDLQGWRISQQVTWDKRGKIFQLSSYYSIYDWVRHDGYNNFASWIA